MRTPAFGLIALAALAARPGSASSASPVTCLGNKPVEERSCTLDLSAGSVAEFQCANPSPSSFPEKMRDWNGVETPVADLFGEGSSVKSLGNSKYQLVISDKATTSAGGITCTQQTSPQQTPGYPSPEDAQKLAIHSLVVRVNKGPEYSQETVILEAEEESGSSFPGGRAVLTSLLAGAAALAFTLF